MVCCFFKQKTAYEMRISDWSSDVCSSDLNGGDGTVQAALTELYQGEHFKGKVPPIAVLPNGKTNLIALDLGTYGDPLKALDRIVDIAKTGLDEHVVARELISLSDGRAGSRRVLGMFLGGAGLERERAEERRGGKEWGVECG